ncbi:MAG TPA: methionine ABC transporter ATP-binding protein [Bradyrhizobium sp.]|nr:methionine ABC transporter ATP-binding protein [Bradyrhizobium sp.]
MNAPFPILGDRSSAAQTRPLIALADIGKVFPSRDRAAEVVALCDVNLEIPEGAIVGVIGKSGAGKSTLIRLVNGLERPSRGRVVVDGIDITALDERGLRAARRSIGMIFQHFNLLSSRTAFENIALPLEIAGVAANEIVKRVEPLLEMVGLSDKRDRYPAELSGGQKQRVGIARALATKPKVLLSDEATSALDPETTDQILALLKSINAELKLTILFITHEMMVVKKLADRVAVLENGRIVEQGATYEIFAHPRHGTTQRFVGAITGSRAPEWLVAKLRPRSQASDNAVLRVMFAGGEADQPILSRLARNLGVDVKILHGQVETIAGRPFGSLFVSVSADHGMLGRIVEELTAGQNTVEHLGYVA